MARIPDDEVNRLKAEVSLQRLVGRPASHSIATGPICWVYVRTTMTMNRPW